jgi:hypothetical protein
MATYISVASGQNTTTAATTTESTTDEVKRSRFDDFLAFPPEYVALLGLGIVFFLLFILVLIIICVTGRAGKGKY